MKKILIDEDNVSTLGELAEDEDGNTVMLHD